MSNTYTQLMYHFVFSTKDRAPCITEKRQRDLYAYLYGINESLKAHTYRIGGIEDHVHVLTSLPRTISVSKYIEQLKSGSSGWIRREMVFDKWPGWQNGYGAFTVSWSDRDRLIEYVTNQKKHHEKEDFLTEYRRLLRENGIEFDERYL